MKLRFAPYTLPLRAPLVTARGTMVDRSGFQIWIGAGRGEAAPLPAFGTESRNTTGSVRFKTRRDNLAGDRPKRWSVHQLRASQALRSGTTRP